MTKKLGKKGLINRIEKGIKLLESKENKTKQEIKDLEKFKVLRSMIGCMNNKLDNEIIATIKRVSTSGMSRNIAFGFITEKRLFNFTYHISVIKEITMNDNHSIRVGGCGMDMIFHTLYSLNGNIVSLLKTYGLLKDNEYSNYNFVVNTSYNTL